MLKTFGPVFRLLLMRGDERVRDEMFSCVTLERRVPQDHPLREIRKLLDAVLTSLNDEFDALYSGSGRPSIAPEYVLRALLLQVFYSIRTMRVSKPDSLTAEDMQPILDSVIKKAEATTRIRDLYRNQPVPIAMYGELTGHSAYEALF